MTKQNILESLLGKGYFPKELPPVFTTTDFGKASLEILSEWEAGAVFKRVPVTKILVPGKGKVKKAGAYTYKCLEADPEVISCPKRGYERRSMSITHPVPQALLAAEIAEHRATIAKWVSRRRYSLDDLHISPRFSRGIRPLNFEAHKAKKAYIEAQADWIVKTDITRFYPTIYTHSISWAAYGKENVKSNRKKFEGSIADRLDTLVRACNRNQTIGVPIGPETSRIIADILSARIDEEFHSSVGDVDDSQIDRLQDDWFLGAPSLEVAETALAQIAACYRKYGLDINGSKTSVGSALEPLSATWVSELGAFLSHNGGPLSRARLRAFLDLVLKLQLDFPKDPVVGYGLSVIESRRSSIADLEALESFLIRAATASPGALNRICGILINLQHDTKRVSLSRVTNRFTQLAERHAAKGNHYEVIWLLYTLRGLGITLKSKALIEWSEAVESSAIILLLLDMRERGQIRGLLPKSTWEDGITAERVTSDWSWLYAYEGIRKGWLRDAKNVMGQPFLQSFCQRDIEFYNPQRNVVRTEAAVIQRSKLRKKNIQDTVALVDKLRGFSASEYSD